MPSDAGDKEAIRIVVLDRNFHLECFRCEVWAVHLYRCYVSPISFCGQWSVVRASLIAACPNGFTPSYIGWTFLSVSSINLES